LTTLTILTILTILLALEQRAVQVPARVGPPAAEVAA